MKSIQVTKSSMPYYEDYVNEIKELWENRWLTNMGIKHQRLEAELKNYLDISGLTLFVNGHIALETALQSFNLEGEVITTPFTFASTTQAIVRNGLTPVFCDVNPKDYTMDTMKIEELITERTAAILPVHVYGNLCNMEAIEKIAEKHNLKVIYDAAHAFGCKYKGRGVGTFGDASMFSFHATKVFNTIEGGAVTYRDPELKVRLEALKNFGMSSPEEVPYIGGNGKMNEFQAAMGLCNLRYIDGEIERRKKVVQRYQQNLMDLEGLDVWKEQREVKHNYAYFPVVFRNYGKSRDQVLGELKREGIYARKYFYPLTSEFSSYHDRFEPGDTPVAGDVAGSVLCLPLYGDLSLEDVDRICQIIKNQR